MKKVCLILLASLFFAACSNGIQTGTNDLLRNFNITDRVSTITHNSFAAIQDPADLSITAGDPIDEESSLYVFDENGNISYYRACNYYDGWSTVTIDYDDEGRVLVEQGTNDFGANTFRADYKWDSDKRYTIHYVTYANEASADYHVEKKGKREVQTMSDENSTTEYIRTFDRNGRLIKEESTFSYTDPELGGTEYKSMSEHNYDERGNIISSVMTSGNDNQRKTSYEYRFFDDRGNWDMRITYVDGVPVSVTERIIEYAL